MQVGVPYLEGGDRAEREDERRAGLACRSVPLEHAMGAHEQPRSDEVRELVRSEAPELAEAPTDQIAAKEDQEAGLGEFSPIFFQCRARYLNVRTVLPLL